MREPVKFKWCRNHHLYYGISLFIFGAYNYIFMVDSNELLMCEPIWVVFMAIGGFLAADDFIEHTITRDTPIRLLFEKVIYPWLLKHT